MLGEFIDHCSYSILFVTGYKKTLGKEWKLVLGYLMFSHNVRTEFCNSIPLVLHSTNVWNFICYLQIKSEKSFLHKKTANKSAVYLGRF